VQTVYLIVSISVKKEVEIMLSIMSGLRLMCQVGFIKAKINGGNLA